MVLKKKSETQEWCQSAAVALSKKDNDLSQNIKLFLSNVTDVKSNTFFW